MITNRRMAAILIATSATLSQAALGQELQPPSDVLATTHVHGLASQENTSEVLMAAHHGRGAYISTTKLHGFWDTAATTS